MKRSIILILVTLLGFSLSAQVPQSFNYQGIARDLTGNPISDQDISLRISILQGSIDGSEVFQEVHNLATNNLGLFNLKIGKGISQSSPFNEITWGTDSHYIQIELDENGDENYHLVGTSELVSVPYALYAGNGSKWHENELGISSVKSVYMNTKGNMGLYENWPLIIKSEAGSNHPYSGALRDRLLAFINRDNQPTWHFGLWNNNFMISESGVKDGRLFIAKGGNVGLSTTVPLSKLHIREGDIFIEDITSGVIMKSPNGKCWRMSVNNSGEAVFKSIACPE